MELVTTHTPVPISCYGDSTNQHFLQQLPALSSGQSPVCLFGDAIWRTHPSTEPDPLRISAAGIMYVDGMQYIFCTP